MHIWSTTEDFSAIISACKSSVLACVKLLEFSEVLWWSGDGFVNFVVIGVPLGGINGLSVLGIGMEIVGVQNGLYGITGEVFCKFNDSVSTYFSFT